MLSVDVKQQHNNDNNNLTKAVRRLGGAVGAGVGSKPDRELLRNYTPFSDVLVSGK